MSYNRAAIMIEGPKGTRIELPKLQPDRAYCTPGGIRAAGPARTLGGLTSRARREKVKEVEPEEGEERQG